MQVGGFRLHKMEKRGGEGGGVSRASLERREGFDPRLKKE
jgi:hypothetical protein